MEYNGPAPHDVLPYTGLAGLPLWAWVVIAVVLILIGVVAYSASAIGGITDRRDGR